MKGGKNLILLLALLALLLGAQAPAHACVILEVYEDPYAAPIRDGEIIDINRQANRVAAAGKVEHDWFINLATGNTGPNRVVAGKEHESGHANGRAGFVPIDSVMQFWESGYAGSNPVLLTGRRIRGASVFNFWLYSDEALSGESTVQVSTSEPLESAFIASDTGSQMTSAALFFASLQSPIIQPAVQYMTLSAEQGSRAKVPEPATLILYGLGFAGAGLYMHWRRSRN